MEKIFIKPRNSVPECVAEWIFNNLSDPEMPSHFADTLALVPTAYAERTLRLMLLSTAQKRGCAAVSGIKILTVESFINRLAAELGARAATHTQKTAAWLRALKSSRTPCIFANGTPQNQYLGETAAEHDTLKSAHADNAADFRWVAEKLAGSPADSPKFETDIWRELAALENSYRKNLADAGLQCPFDILAKTVECAAPQFNTIVVCAHPDVPSFMERLLDNAGKTARIITLIPDEDARAEDFDKLGRPRGHFENAEIALTPRNAFAFDSIADEASAAAHLAGEYGAQAYLKLAIACEQTQSARIFGRAFEKAGCAVAARCRMRKTHAETAVGKLFAAAEALALSPAFSRFFDFIQNPLVSAHLSGNSAQTAREIIRAADEMRENRVPPSVSAALEIIKNTGHKFSDVFAEAARIARNITSKGAKAAAMTVSALCQNLPAPVPPAEAEAAAALEKCAADLQPFGGEFSPEEEFSIMSAALGARQSLPENSDTPSIILQNWLEIFWSSAPHVLLCDMNEGVVPMPENGGQFMTDSLRQRLGLKNSQSRKWRDAYMLKTLIATRPDGRAAVLYSAHAADESPLMPSRILMQAKNLPERVEFLLSPPPKTVGGASVPARIKLRAKARLGESFTMSASAFKSYLDSPLSFYFKYVLRAAEVQPEKSELDAMQFGVIFHETLRRWALSKYAPSTNADEISKYLEGELGNVARERFAGELSAQTRIQLVSMRQRLRALAKVQALRAADGWLVWETPERPFKTEIGGAKITGVIDRIDYNERLGAFAVIDYKTRDKFQSGIARKSHIKQTRDGGIEWLDMQLPIYTVAARQITGAKRIVASLFVAPTDASSTGIDDWEISPEELESAVAKMREIIEQIRAGNFASDIEPKYELFPDTFNMSPKTMTELFK